MLLLIDNYDSFTYNLYQHLCELGADVAGRPQRRGHHRRNGGDGARAHRCLARACTPREAGVSVELIRRFAGRVPILGFAWATSASARLRRRRGRRRRDRARQAVPHPPRRQGRAGRPANPFPAVRYHSLAIQREGLPESLEVTAWTDRGVIMAVRHKEMAVEGVQFHPESILTDVGKDILRNFLEMRS